MTCGSPSRWHASRAAITASGEQQARSECGPSGSVHSLSVTPRASGPARRSATAESTPPLIATATRPGAGGARKTGPSAFASASTASVSPPTAAASKRVRPRRPRSRPSASASTIRSPSTRRRTSAQRPSREESPLNSCTASVCPTLPIAPPRSEPGRTRWVPCGPTRLPTRRTRRWLPRFGCWFYIGRRSHEQGRAPRQSSQRLRLPGRSSSGSSGHRSAPRAPQAQGSARTRSRARGDRGRPPSSGPSCRRR